ncbi:hypothetical protein niasHT_004012 [Heterodera trifolii]|uniref:Protein kinase domain-containing protein n=1 Tax=Heterodera trifolii TaxID=157864 RepID=A0ABD2M4A0_9BILA
MDPSFSLEDIFQKNAKMIRSAFSYISQASNQLLQSATAASSAADAKSHPLVGQTLTIGHHSYAVRSLLAEGGYALVFAVEALKNDRSHHPSNECGGGQWYALKRQLAADREAADAVVREINFLKQLNGHPSIVRFRNATKNRGGTDGRSPPSSASASSSFSQSSRHFCEFFVLTELCSGGPLIDVMSQGPPLRVDQVCKILYATAQAINHMHDRNPPITHRDIKIENLLFDAHGHIKLCDFGSATTDIYRPCDEWSALVRSQLEEEIAKFTTPMYRAPEVLDTYQNFPIGPAQDIWALGCVLFYLCYRVHPFEDSAKLRILNAKYTLPAHSEYKVFHDLIRQMLQPDPYSRPSIQDLCEQIEQLALALDVGLDEPVLTLTAAPTTTTTTSSSSNNGKSKGGECTAATTTTKAQQKPPQQRHEQPIQKQHQKQQGLYDDDEDDPLTTLRPSMEIPNDGMGRSRAAPAPEKVLINFDLSAEKPAPTNSSSTTRTTDVPAAVSAARNCSDLSFLFDLGMPSAATAPTPTTEATSSSSTAPSATTEAADNMQAACDALGAEFLINLKMPAAETRAATSSGSTTTELMAPADEGPNTCDASDPKQMQKACGGSSNNLEDILSSVFGFTSSTKASNRSLADMVKENDALLMDPLSVQIRDWTSGKERNIRALLGSLNAILWEEAAHQWKQPTMAELFVADNVKKQYHRACLVVHPDKLVGSVHEPLAKAIFTELNDAWTEFQKNASAS